MSKKTNISRRWRPTRGVVIFVFIVAIVWAGLAIRSYARQRAVVAGMTTDTISAIEFRPNGDWEVVTLESDQDIERFLVWLTSTGDANVTRSAPPPTVYEGVIRFVDGRKEEFRISASMEAKNERMRHDAVIAADDNTSVFEDMRNHEPPILSPRSDVRIYFRDVMRTGDRQPLIDLISSKTEAK